MGADRGRDGLVDCRRRQANLNTLAVADCVSCRNRAGGYGCVYAESHVRTIYQWEYGRDTYITVVTTAWVVAFSTGAVYVGVGVDGATQCVQTVDVTVS